MPEQNHDNSSYTLPNETLSESSKDPETQTLTKPSAELPIYETISPVARRSVLAAVFLAVFLSSLDQNVVVVALPKISTAFGHPELLSWVLAAYILTTSGTMALYGRFSDVYGRRPIFIFAVGVFFVGSTLSAASVSMWMLIVARGVQGVGGGGLMSIGMVIVGDVMPPAKRPVWMSLISLCFAASSVIGPFLGGFFTDYLSWRWVFWINLPLAGAAILVTIFALRLQVPTQVLPLDVLGALLIVAAAICTVLFVSWGGQVGGYPWNSGIIIALIVLAGFLYVGFILQELRHPLPIINVKLFATWNFTVIMILMFFAGTLVLGAFAYLPIYFQSVRNDSATISGLKLLPLIAGFLISGAVSTIVMTKTGKFRALVPIGAVICALGLGLPISLTPTTPYWAVALYLLLMGLGSGLIFPVTTTVIQNSLPPAEMANGLSSLTFFQTMGSAVGIAILGAVLTGQTNARLQTGSDAKEAFCFGLDWVFVISTVFCFVVLVLSFFIRPANILQKHHEVAPAV